MRAWKEGAAWQPAALEEAIRFPSEGLEGEVRDGSPQRSTGRSQDSRMRAWKEGAAWQPAALEEAKIPECEGLEGGAGWQPAAQHWKKPRFPNEGLEGGCCVAACSTGEAKIPE